MEELIQQIKIAAEQLANEYNVTSIDINIYNNIKKYKKVSIGVIYE